jgi:hypothetical protein
MNRGISFVIEIYLLVDERHVSIYIDILPLLEIKKHYQLRLLYLTGNRLHYFLPFPSPFNATTFLLLAFALLDQNARLICKLSETIIELDGRLHF